MKNDFDSWLDFENSSQYFNDSHQLQTPISQEENWQITLKTQNKAVIDDSNELFPSIKRKYEEKFLPKTQKSTSSSSPFEEDDESPYLDSKELKLTKNQKEHIKKIEQQNRYLKQKVDDLSFRLRQTQLELNKLKYSGNNSIANFESMKQNYLKEITVLFENKKGHAEKTCEVFKKLRELTDFDGKLKVDLMNYFMSELLENIINESTFYYLDSILKRKGLWKENQTEALRKVDEEVIEAGQLEKPQILKDFKNDLKQAISIPGQKYKDCWKEFYRSYIALLNQGFVLENFLRMAMGRILTYVDKQNIGRIEIHFQKIKLRKDIRLLRQSWFKEIQYEEANENKDEKSGYKKYKF